MSSLLKCAVVGVGYLGRFHAQKYKSLENVSLEYVCDSFDDQAKKVAEELSVKYTSDYKSLVGKIDAVTIASTTSTHFEIAKFFLENGINVLIEKPMTTTSEEGQVLCDLAKKNNLKLQVGHIERFNSAFLSAKEKLTKPLFIECHRLAPFNPRGNDVSVVLDLMIHDIDVVLSLVKSKPIQVQSVSTPVLTETSDIANARVQFESGAVANITASRISKTAQRKFRVFQKDQYLSIDFGEGKVDLYSKTGELKEGELPIKTESWNLEKSDALLEETKAFVASVIDDTPCMVTGEDGLQALILAEKIIDAQPG